MTIDKKEIQLHGGYSGFPYSHVQFLRCPFEGENLKVKKVTSGSAGFVRDGLLDCGSCGHEFPIIDGILRMLDLQELDAEAMHELRLRDQYSTNPISYPDAAWDEQWGQLEMKPQLATLNLIEGSALLEFACGRGRYTIQLMGKCKALLAVDFSLESLRILADKIPSGKEVGLVQADITRLALSPKCFDRVMSTSCLDSREQRMAMHRLAADALKDKGRYVYGVEFNDLRTRLLGSPRAERYAPGDMLYYRLDREDVIRETAPFFKHIKVRPIQVSLPFASRLSHRWRLIIARIAEKIPVACEFGELLLVSAEAPIRHLEEGQYSSGNRFAKTIYEWYRRNRSKTSKRKM